MNSIIQKVQNFIKEEKKDLKQFEISQNNLNRTSYFKKFQN